jgi:outer membrane protein assembly factor BamD (BamD/ComL family)
MSTHLVKNQKMTKRQIKEDPLVTAAFRATEVWERYGRAVLIAAGALVLVGLLVFFVLRTRSQAEEQARGDLFRSMVSMNQGDYAAATPLLKQIVDNAPGTNAARDAMLMLGDAYVGQRNAKEAAAWYQRFLDKAGGTPALELAGTMGLATALEDQGEFAKAAGAYHRVTALAKSDNERGRAMLAEARTLLRAGQAQKAIEVYTAIAALSGAEIPIRDAANMHLGELQATTAAP